MEAGHQAAGSGAPAPARGGPRPASGEARWPLAPGGVDQRRRDPWGRRSRPLPHRSDTADQEAHEVIRRYRTTKKPPTISAMISSSKPSTVMPRLLARRDEPPGM